MADLIDRQAVIMALVFSDDTGGMTCREIAKVLNVIKAAPRLPERKTGKWIYNSPVTMKCNQCGLVIKDWDWHRFKYCPHCGADMREVSE